MTDDWAKARAEWREIISIFERGHMSMSAAALLAVQYCLAWLACRLGRGQAAIATLQKCRAECLLKEVRAK